MYDLAQLNIGRALGPMDSDVMAEFKAGLDPVNTIAEQSEGFIWRLKDDSGNATNIQAFDDPDMLVNMSVWQNVDSLKKFMFKTHHADFLKQKKRWFEQTTDATYVLWWIPQGSTPTIEEAMARLTHLRENGDTQFAFTFSKPFEQPE